MSSKDIDVAILAIRKEYEQSPYANDNDQKGFDERYCFALESRYSLPRFIDEEKAYLIELKERGSALKKKEPLSLSSAKVSSSKSYADKVIDQYRHRIEHYSSLPISDKASVEVEKLYGALVKLDKEYWRSISQFIRSYHSSSHSYGLEDRLNRMVLSSGKSQIPPDLAHYLYLIDSGSHSTSEIYKESQNCIKRASFFLHELKMYLDQAKNRGIMDETLEIAYKYVEDIIVDFRLKDLKPAGLSFH